MRSWIGTTTDVDRIAVERAVPGMELWSAAASAELVRGEDVVIPWSLALHAADLLEAEGDRETTLRASLPPWLSPDDVELLLDVVSAAKLPQRTPLRLRLEYGGVPGRSGFELRAVWTTGVDRVVREQPTVHVGTLSYRQGPPRRLTSGQYAALAFLSKPLDTGRDRARDLTLQAQLLAVVPAGDPGVVIDRALEQNRAVVVDAVRPRLVPVADGYQVRPSVPGVPDADVENYYYETPPSQIGQRPLVARDGETRTRVVLGDRAVEGLKSCRRIDTLTPEQTAHALSHPEEVFGDALDLSQLSERVTGLGPEIRHVYPTLRELKSTDWWDWDVPLGLEGEDPDHAPTLKDPETRDAIKTAIERADAAGDHYIPSPDGRGLIPITTQLREAIRTADDLATRAPAPSRAPKPPREVLQVLENVESLTFDRAAAVPAVQPLSLGPPPGVRATLYPYQQHGFEWLASLYEAARGDGHSWHGALLADDMGLGKTLQVLSFLAWRRQQGGRGPHLVVAPVALLENWQREADRFFGAVHEPILQIVGKSMPAKPEQAAARLSAHQLVLVSYETLRRYEHVFSRVRWDVIVLDEAQKAKDPSTQVARVIRTLHAKFRLAMTGTPVENTLRELWTLYDWAAPGLLGSLRDFADDFIKPLADGSATPTLAAELHDRIRPVFLRRMKQGTLEGLPAIHHHRLDVALSPEQERRYQAELSSPLSEGGVAALGRLQRLFGMLAHPSLGAGLDDELPPRSELDFPRSERTFALLDDIARRREKVILFANRKAVQAWLAREVGARFGIEVGVINGDLDESRARLRQIDEFSAQPGFGALVLAPRAAGVGLNITAANHVIHYTREWNPAIENQATDRAYRLGQTRPVHVYYLIAKSARGTTVDEKLDELLAAKRQLMSDFVVPMGGFTVQPGELANAESA